jgi:hypothetical protein
MGTVVSMRSYLVMNFGEGSPSNRPYLEAREEGRIICRMDRKEDRGQPGLYSARARHTDVFPGDVAGGRTPALSPQERETQ